jgi:hypothetical protein
MQSARRYLEVLWIGAGVQIIGRIIDGIWHATHDEFETASDQLQAHTVIWIGVLVTLVGSALAMRSKPRDRNIGYPVVLVASIVYAGVAAWHFIEHANHSDPDLPHVLIAVTWVVLLGGVLLATMVSRHALQALR